MTALRHALDRSKAGSSTLTAVGLVMAGLLPVFVLGMIVDQREILGAPAWLKPAKFAASTSLYSFTTAWILSFFEPWHRLRRAVGSILAGVFVLEVALIAVQSARGTTSHFNIATPFDAVVFAVMGAAIMIATGATVALTVAAFRHRFEDEALGWAIRLGLAVSIAGSLVGAMMTRPTRAQMDTARAGVRLQVAGAHTVGAPDGGPGLPGTGWSVDHGDLRVPHFVGLHALQALPIVALVSGRRLAPLHRKRAVFVAAAAYAALFLILLAQAQGGQSLVAPDRTALAVLGIWALASTMTMAFVVRAGRSLRAAGASIHPEVRR